MPPSTTSSFYIVGATLTIAFEPKVIVCLTDNTFIHYCTISTKINGAWKTIYKMDSNSTNAVQTSNTYTVTENGDGTYTVPMAINISGTAYQTKWFAIG